MEWSTLFDAAFLGTVQEYEELGSGFGGTVFVGRLGHVEVVTKKLHSTDEALFKELYIGLLAPASPCVGFAVAADHSLRLVSARLDETLLEFLSRDPPIAARKQVALGALSAVSGLADLGLVHCDLKPDNFMVHEGAVYLIDFGSTSLEGDTLPLTCRSYASIVSV